MKRRTWIQSVAAVLLTGPIGRLRALAQAPAAAPALTDANVATLAAVADVVLPSALGPSGRTAAVDRFVKWIREYREGADRGYSYGSSTLSQPTGLSPATRYVTQFAALDDAAKTRGATSFAALSAAQRQDVIEAFLDQPQRVTALPTRPNGANLVADFMGYYFGSESGWDVAYDAAIGRDSCRGLDGSDQRPMPLRRG
jgi:hypothetical protein